MAMHRFIKSDTYWVSWSLDFSCSTTPSRICLKDLKYAHSEIKSTHTDFKSQRENMQLEIIIIHFFLFHQNEGSSLTFRHQMLLNSWYHAVKLDTGFLLLILPAKCTKACSSSILHMIIFISKLARDLNWPTALVRQNYKCWGKRMNLWQPSSGKNYSVEECKMNQGNRAVENYFLYRYQWWLGDHE